MRTAISRPYSKLPAPWVNVYRVTITTKQQGLYDFYVDVRATEPGQAICRAITGLRSDVRNGITEVSVEQVETRVRLV